MADGQDGDLQLPAELRSYLIACVSAARPSLQRARVLRLLCRNGGPQQLTADVDWDGIEAEALARGCTVADVVYERAGRRFPDASF